MLFVIPNLLPMKSLLIDGIHYLVFDFKYVLLAIKLKEKKALDHYHLVVVHQCGYLIFTVYMKLRSLYIVELIFFFISTWSFCLRLGQSWCVVETMNIWMTNIGEEVLVYRTLSCCPDCVAPVNVLPWNLVLGVFWLRRRRYLQLQSSCAASCA